MNKITLLQLGQRHWEQKNYAEALNAYQKILQQDPKHAKALYYCAHIYAVEGDYTKAIQCAKKALQQVPKAIEIRLHLGFWHNAISEHKQALHYLEPLQQACGDNPAYFAHLGHAYRRLYHAAKSLEAVQQALRLAFQCWQKHWDTLGEDIDHYQHTDIVNKKYYCQRLLQTCQAVRSWYEYLQIYRQDCSRSLYSMKKLDQAWLIAESRQFQMEHYRDILLTRPYWRGENLNDATVLILAEQGIGDELHFSNCFDDIYKAARHCIFNCDPRLAELFQRNFPQATFLSQGRAKIIAQLMSHCVDINSIDYVVLASSLLYHYRQHIDQFPRTPWLKPEQQRDQFWKNKIQSLGPGLKIGLSWRSLKGRSIQTVSPMYLPLTALLPLLKVPETIWINLQYDQPEEELQDLEQNHSIKIHQLDNLDVMNDFESLAALLTNLDLCIVPMNSTFALAGALEVKSWLFAPLSPMMPLCGQDFSPYAPLATVYQKETFYDWSPVINEMHKDLKNWVQHHG